MRLGQGRGVTFRVSFFRGSAPNARSGSLVFLRSSEFRFPCASKAKTNKCLQNTMNYLFILALYRTLVNVANGGKGKARIQLRVCRNIRLVRSRIGSFILPAMDMYAVSKTQYLVCLHVRF